MYYLNIHIIKNIYFLNHNITLLLNIIKSTKMCHLSVFEYS